jgi:BlaI family penicillinase repressor
MADDPQISDAEWEVMDVVWDRAPVTAAEVIAALAPKTNWRPTTVKTMLHRLVKKKVLAFKRERNRYVYLPKRSRAECAGKASQSFVDRVFGGEALPMVLHFVRSGRLSQEELDELRTLLDREDPKRG